MKRVANITILLSIIAIASGCATIPEPKHPGSDSFAKGLLEISALAEGSNHLLELHNIKVKYEGAWSWIVPRVQPVLVDNQFRINSDDDYLVGSETVMQKHTGPGGIKIVNKTPTDIHVLYNGKESFDSEVQDAAALVVDDDRMFLFGPAFFLQRNAPVQYLGCSNVDGLACDDLLADLRPGLGHSAADRVILSIDQKQHYLRRVRITVEGLSTTKGAVADIYLRDLVRINGIVFPTRFYEELKNPFDASVHDWRLVGIELKE